MPGLPITLDIARDDGAPIAARRALDGMAAGIGEAVLDDARLLVTELVVNAVRHGAGDTVRLVVDAPGAGRLRCEVGDDGRGFVPATAERAGGWGLRLVASLAAAWGVRGDAASVWFELAPRRG